MLFGCGLAWLGARTDVPWKGLVHLSGVMPLFVSLLVAAVTWSLLGAGFSGYLNIIFRSLGLPFGIEMRSLAGIAIVEGLYYAPYAYIFLYGALTLVHPDLEEAAAVHGGNTGADLAHDQLSAGQAGADRLGVADVRADRGGFSGAADFGRAGRHRNAVDAHLQHDDAHSEPSQPGQRAQRRAHRRGLGAGLYPAPRARHPRLPHRHRQGPAAARHRTRALALGCRRLSSRFMRLSRSGCRSGRCCRARCAPICSCRTPRRSSIFPSSASST